MQRRRSVRQSEIAKAAHDDGPANLINIVLTEKAKIGLQTLFSVMDKTGDGVLSSADFQPSFGSKRTLAMWEELRLRFDRDLSGDVTHIEFIATYKSLSMDQPLEMSAFGLVPSTNIELLTCLQNSANATLIAMCEAMYACVSDYAATPSTPGPWWDAHPEACSFSQQGLSISAENQQRLEQLYAKLDKDGSGALDPNDFICFDPNAQRAATQRWQVVQRAFDIDGDQQVTATEVCAPSVLKITNRPRAS
jgi:Ca2+-binding EF-hand superfamily protein